MSVYLAIFMYICLYMYIYVYFYCYFNVYIYICIYIYIGCTIMQKKIVHGALGLGLLGYILFISAQICPDRSHGGSI